MTQVMLSAYSRTKLESKLKRLQSLNWIKLDEPFLSGVVWYQAIGKE